MATIYPLLSVCILLVGVSGDYKQWIHSTNFEDPKNWNVGRLPCSADHVSFPETSPSVYVQTNTSILELVLPNSGELIFGKYASLGASLPGSQDPACPGEDVQYIGDQPRSWYDPDNWCTTYGAEGQCIASQPVVLETERVPCLTEGVAFPADRTFLVDIDTGVDIEIMSLQIGATTYDTGSFRRFMDSDEGKKQFIRKDGRTQTTVNIRDNPCTDVTGCQCGNDKGAIQDRICEKYSRINGSCPDVQCGGALMPQGGCCNQCGALFELAYSQTTFRKSSFESMIKSRYLRDNPSVQSIVSKTQYDMIQVLLFDQEGGDTAASVGKQLNDYLVVDGGDQYGITDVKLDVSQPTHPTHAPHKGGMSGGSVAGLILGLLILLGVLGLAVFCFTYYRSNNRVPRPNVNLPSAATLKRNLPNTASLKRTLSRFSKGEKNGDLELGPSVAFKDGAVNYADLGGFDNPMYGNLSDVKMSAVEGAEAQPVTLVAGGGSDDRAGFSNPMYGQGPPPVVQGRRNKERYDSCDITDFPDMSVEGLVNPLYGTDLGGPTQSTQRSSSPFHHRIDSDYKSGGFSNPLYGQAPGTQEISHGGDGSTFLHLNPVFSTEGVEEDSEI